MNELISVIIPIYNVEKYLKKSIISVINQTYKNLEIILVDDGSTDSSGNMCDEFAKQDNRIKVIHKKNGGLSDARNAGISEAKGKYLGFIDSDDYVDKNFYKILYSLLKKYDSDISVCEYKETFIDDEENNLSIDPKEQIFNTEQALKELLFGKIKNYAWNKLYKRELFDGIYYPVGKKMEDVGTTYLAIKKSKTIVITNYVGYYYRQREGSIMASRGSKLILDTRDMVNKRYEDLRTTKLNLIDELNINRLTFIRFYFEDLGKLSDRSILPELKKEYDFYKKNYKKYKKFLKDDSQSKTRKFDYIILYYSDKLLIGIYALKTKIKRLIKEEK